jgi:hypothetical protein
VYSDALDRALICLLQGSLPSPRLINSDALLEHRGELCSSKNYTDPCQSHAETKQTEDIKTQQNMQFRTFMAQSPSSEDDIRSNTLEIPCTGSGKEI